MAQERMESNGGEQQQPPSQDLFQGIDIDATLARASSVTEKVRVVHGVNEGYYSLEGKTVGHARKSLREIHNIPGDAKAVVGGKEVNDDFVLTGGMALEFTKEAGVKGKPAYNVKLPPEKLTPREKKAVSKMLLNLSVSLRSKLERILEIE